MNACEIQLGLHHYRPQLPLVVRPDGVMVKGNHQEHGSAERAGHGRRIIHDSNRAKVTAAQFRLPFVVSRWSNGFMVQAALNIADRPWLQTGLSASHLSHRPFVTSLLTQTFSPL